MIGGARGEGFQVLHYDIGTCGSELISKKRLFQFVSRVFV